MSKPSATFLFSAVLAFLIACIACNTAAPSTEPTPDIESTVEARVPETLTTAYAASATPTPTTIPGSFFTLGSSRDEVFEVQGDPNWIGRPHAIIGKGDPTKEVWYYGQYHFKNNVVFSRETGLVISWNNTEGNLNVGMIPGPNTTSSDFFTVGSHQDDVARLQGAPDFIFIGPGIRVSSDEVIWSYGDSDVILSSSGIVRWWDDGDGVFKIGMVAGPDITKSEFFSIGSPKDDVVRLQGSPDEVTFRGRTQTWHYGPSKIVIDSSTSLVQGWSDAKQLGWSNAKQLKAKVVPGPNVTDSDFFTIGSHKDDVAMIHGTPSAIYWQSEKSGVCWRYDGGTVCFTPDGLVKQWAIFEGRGTPLKILLVPDPQVTSADYFTLGSTKDDVVRIQGTPTVYRPYRRGHEWHYGQSIVKFGDSERVVRWENVDGNLKARIYVPK